MAPEKEIDASEKAGRGVTRTIMNTTVLLVSLAVLLGWAWQGVYELAPGESAVILRLGAFDRVRSIEGPWVHWPPPLESHRVVNTSRSRTESFGAQPTRTTQGKPGDAEEVEIAEQIKRDAIQTVDSNIVNVAYELQYKVADPFSFAFSMANPDAILHDATEAAMRSVIGSRTIDAVLSQDRQEVAQEAEDQLTAMLASYSKMTGHDSAFSVERINLEKPQAPEAVREAFADVVSAGQDGKRSSLVATGDAREIMERARSEVAELLQQAEAYKRSKTIEAQGEATRFTALVTEYKAAPEVTRRRLYLETMEAILPDVEKVIVEPNTVNMLPMFPLGNSGSRAAAQGAAQ